MQLWRKTITLNSGVFEKLFVGDFAVIINNKDFYFDGAKSGEAFVLTRIGFGYVATQYLEQT